MVLIVPVVDRFSSSGTVFMGRWPVLLTRLTFELFTALRWPCDMEFGRAGTGGGIIFPNLLSDVTLDEEFFRCREPGRELEFEVGEFSSESLVRGILLFIQAERARDIVTDGVVPAEVPERTDIVSSARVIFL